MTAVNAPRETALIHMEIGGVDLQLMEHQRHVLTHLLTVELNRPLEQTELDVLRGVRNLLDTMCDLHYAKDQYIVDQAETNDPHNEKARYVGIAHGAEDGGDGIVPTVRDPVIDPEIHEEVDTPDPEGASDTLPDIFSEDDLP